MAITIPDVDGQSIAVVEVVVEDENETATRAYVLVHKPHVKRVDEA